MDVPTVLSRVAFKWISGLNLGRQEGLINLEKKTERPAGDRMG